MNKDDLNKSRFIIGSMYVDTVKNRLFIKDMYNDDYHEVKTGTTLLLNGKNATIYYKTEQVGYFLAEDGKQKISNYQDAVLWLPKKMNNDLKDFLYNYIDIETLNEFVDILKKYDVTLYDCISFVESHEEVDDKQLTGVNSILFHSKTTYGYCYVIHRYNFNEEKGLAINNNFEIMDIDGRKHTV